MQTIGDSLASLSDNRVGHWGENSSAESTCTTFLGVWTKVFHTELH